MSVKKGTPWSRRRSGKPLSSGRSGTAAGEAPSPEDSGHPLPGAADRPGHLRTRHPDRHPDRCGRTGLFPGGTPASLPDPEKRIREILDYQASRPDPYLIPDPVLGWTIAPHGAVKSGIYRRIQGIRSDPREYELIPPEGTLRIALFGDSFTHGDEEPYPQTWGKLLEDELRRRGIRAEVLNFGVPAYGLGQAYLRWNRLGRRFSPLIAVLGFQVENIKRTLNIFRLLYSSSSGLPFSKPRFTLDNEGNLRPVNSPTIPPEEVLSTLKNFNSHPLEKYEYWYNPKAYSSSLWTESRFLRLLYTFLFRGKRDRKEGPGWLAPAGEGPRVTLALIRKFAQEVRGSAGSRSCSTPRPGNR